MSTASLGSRDAKLPDELDLLIIGGGVMGLSIAYNLARNHPGALGRVAVVERSYLVSGASGRNGGGLRMQWGDAGNVALMRESIELCRHLAQELGINLWFRQGGYLFLARTESGERRLHRNVAVHEQVGVPTRLLAAREALELVPQLDVSEVRVAAYNPEDGVVFPWPFVWGYAARAIAHGVAIRTHTSVDALEPDADGGYRVTLSTGERLRAARVINATGAWSVGINRGLGIELPNHPHRHEILSSEPLKPFLDPLVVDLETGLYFSQSTRGEIVTGITLPDPPGLVASHEVELGSTLRFLSNVSRALIRVMPIARHLKPLRQWSGPYDISPDGDAMVGPSPDHPQLIQVCGFTGHGFMMAPAVGRMVARWLATGESHPMLERWDPCRFRDGRQLRREDMIIG
ncbi:NAD(P)/FAD-dependent oxidoreductase [Enhygromyxa salina]|uniref:Sarcosine oxidase subunit beta n=1 Tax=Enhygromyxa salina TaxID=215803 RepID=A0A2S9YPG8_9BACT|nr:FAD-binding oxidoreductase [Enhygromyxa salina]PRQ06980.1 Sarcosine oxidase subunit beta [Enhygromyxa salina]